MKRNFTKLLAALALLAFLMPAMTTMGQTTHTIGWGQASGSSGTYSNFTATTGTVQGILGFECAKNSASSSPAYSSTNDELRLYYASNGSGNSITLTPVSGVTITKVVINASSSSYTPTVKYTVNNGSATSISASGTTYTISGISATSSLMIQNANTTNKQLRITTIVITYTSGGGTSYTVTAAKETGISTAYVAAGSSFSGTSTSVSVSSGGSATFQATVASGYTFDGWYNGSNRVSQNTTYTQTNITSALTLTAKATSSGGSGGGNGDYVLVSESQSDWSGDYVLAYNSSSTQVRVLKGKAGSNNYGDYVTVTPSGNTLAASDVEAYNISIEAVTYNNSTCYTLKQDGKYLGYTGSNGNYLYFSDDTGNTPQQYYWTINYSGSTLTITNVNQTGRFIKWNNTSNQYRFACYTSSSSGMKDISLYKKEIVGAYTVTCNAANNGTITASPTSADEGATVTITATPNTGYELTALTYTPAGGSAQNISIASTPYTFTMPAANVTVNATFAKKNYTITYNTPTHGSITTGPTSAQYGDNVSIVTSPASGYQLQGITVTNSSNNQAVAVSGNGNSRSFTMPAANVSVVVTFEQIQYSVTCNTASNGTITASPTLAAENATVTITATPSTGYELATITATDANNNSITLSGSGNTRTFTMPAANVTVNATFSLANYTVTCASPSNGTLSASPTNNVHYQDPVTVTATPNNGYQLTALTYTPASGTAQNIDIASTPYTFSMPAANVTVNATFQPFRTAHFSVNGTIDPSNDFTGIQGTAITFPSNPADIGGKTFVGWVTDEIPCINNQAPTFITSATMGNSDVTYYACYANVISGDATTATDVLTREITGVTANTTNYSNWNNITLNSEAVYAGNSAGGNNSIQLRTNSGTTGYSGIITTHSGGKATKVTIEWNSNTANDRELGVYGKNSAYSSTSDLYGTDQGTLLGTIARANSTELTIDGDYTFIGLRSQSAAMYLTSVSIEWTSGTPDTYSSYCTSVHATPTNLSTNNITSSSAQLSWTGEQQSYEVEYRYLISEESETTTTEPASITYDFSSNVQGWTTIDADGHGDAWSYQSSGGRSGGCMNAEYNSDYDHQDYLVSPQITLGGSLSFYAKRESSSYADRFRVYLSTSGNTSASDFTIELTNGNVTPTTSYQEYTYSLSNYSGTGYVAIVYTAIADQDVLYVDDITINYSATNTTTVPAVYSEWQTASNSTTSPYNLTGLDPNTTYQWHVRGIVDAQNNCYTEWSAMDTFTTLSGYTITATADPNEGGSVSGGGTYNPNASCTLTAEANPGYTFTNWTKGGNVVSTNSTYTFTVTESGEYVANFTINSYTVNVTAGANGSATQSGNGTYTHGTECTITATAATGYHFVEWAENNSLVSTENPYTFQVEDDRDLVANFAINSYAVTIEASPSNGGTLTGSASGDYNHGATVSVTATANTGYHFVNWTVNGDEVSTSTTLSNYAITDECTILANFAINSYAVTIEASQGGSISGSTSGNYNHGATVNVTATATTGYHFVNWTVDDVEESTSTALTYTITGACTIRANFEPDTFIISASVAPENSGSLNGAGTYNYNSTCTLTATANEGYTFVNWTKNGVTVSSSATYSFTVTTDASYVANFQRNSYRITVAAVPSNGGNVTGAGNYNHGVSVTVTATAFAGYQFVSWTRGSAAGQVMSTSASYTFTATEAIDLVANFLYVVVQPTVTTNSQVTNITGSSAQCGGQITSTGNGTISAYGFCWNTTGNPTTQDQHQQVGYSTSEPFTYNITGLSANTLYYVRAYATNQEGTAYGNQVTFATQAQVTTASVTAHTLDAIMGGSWVSGSGDETVSACGVEYKAATASTWQTASMSVPASGTSFSGTVSGLTANTSYVVRAYVTNGGGTSYGAETTFSTIGYFAVSATVDPAESGTVTFSPAGDGQGNSAQTVQIGTGSIQQNFYPINTAFAYSFDEMIYPGGGEMTAGNITHISFRLDGSNASSSYSFDVFLKTVGSTSVFTNGQPIELASNDKYYTGTVTVTRDAQWVTIELDSPFDYNGTDNILVGVDYNGGSGSLRNWYATETNAVTCVGYYGESNINPTVYPIVSDNSLYNFAVEYDMMYLCTQRPNIQFTIEAAGANTQWYSWGSTPELTAEPATGYQFLNWTENGQVVSTDNPYTLESIEADRNLVANFVICKTFTNADGDHDWDNAANWAPAGVPNGEDVVIAAAATISDGTVATVNNISISTGSITIEDGGQLKHNNNGVVVTTEKSITGYGHANYETNKGYYLISSPVNGISYSNISGLATAEYDLYSFESDHTESNGDLTEWVVVNGNLVAKKGYLYASETNTTLAVTGTVTHSATPIVETLTYNSGYRFGGWNLVGNPFVCDAYVTSSSNEMNYYVLNHTADYDEFITASSSDPIAPMGGLMVQATAANQTITYSRIEPSKGSGILNMDVHKTSVRGIATLDRARVRFGEGINLEKFQFNPRHTKISIPEGGNEYSVYYADGAGTIPVNFKAEDNGRYTLDFSTEEVGFNYLHLIDNMNGNDVDLLETPYYSFDAKSTDYASRFTLVFATGNNDDETTFAFFNNGNWIINNDGKATLQVVDALGRILSSETISGSCSKAINAAPGVYMLRLINGDNVKVQKVVVKR